jgi:hypothetical protein
VIRQCIDDGVTQHLHLQRCDRLSSPGLRLVSDEPDETGSGLTEPTPVPAASSLRLTTAKKLRIGLIFFRGDTKWFLNEGQPPSFRGVRVALRYGKPAGANSSTRLSSHLGVHLLCGVAHLHVPLREARRVDERQVDSRGLGLGLGIGTCTSHCARQGALTSARSIREG